MTKNIDYEALRERRHQSNPKFYDTQAEVLDDIWSISEKLIKIGEYKGELKDNLVNLMCQVEDLDNPTIKTQDID